jgi:hypothetical protein
VEPLDRKPKQRPTLRDNVVEIIVLFLIILPYLLIFDYATGRWTP